MTNSENEEPDGFEVISVYSDDDALDDGVLIRLPTNTSNSPHRIAVGAFAELSDYHRRRGYERYADEDFKRFYFNELMPLTGYAQKRWAEEKILKTNYDFRVGDWKGSRVIWYIPNEVGGITMMRPADY